MENYLKKSLWKWILLYVIIGVVVYGAIYYFFFYPSTWLRAGKNAPQNYQAQTQNSSNETAKIISIFQEQGGSPKTYLTDLNKDGYSDLLVFVSGADFCGTGGCSLFVYQGNSNGNFNLISTIDLVQAVYLGDTYTNEWRDLIIGVGGGGYVGTGFSKLQYDGKTYPPNPTTDGVEVNTPSSNSILN